MRTKLPDRRANTTIKVLWEGYNGAITPVLVTIGFDETGAAKEVFCADFKAGSDLLAIVTDACVLVSRLLQHGDLSDELIHSMCSPLSLVGTIVKAVHTETQYETLLTPSKTQETDDFGVELAPEIRIPKSVVIMGALFASILVWVMLWKAFEIAFKNW